MDSNSQKKNKALISGTIIYAIGGFGTKILSFLIVPLYTYYVVPQELGVYDFVMTLTNLMLPIVTIQIGDAAYRWIIGDVRDEFSSGDYVAISYKRILLHMIPVTIFAALLFLITGYKYLPCTYCIVLAACFYNTMQKITRGYGNQKLFALCGIVYTFVMLLMNVIQICVLKRGIDGMFLSVLLGYIAADATLLAADKRLRINPFKAFLTKSEGYKQLEKRMVKFAIPLVSNQLNWWIMSSSDRLIIRFFLGSFSNGIYSVSYKFPTVLQQIFSLFTNSWQDVSIADGKGEQEGYEFSEEIDAAKLQDGKGEQESCEFSEEIDAAKLPDGKEKPGEGQNSEYYSAVFDKYSVLVFSVVMLAMPLSQIYVLLFMEQQYHASAFYIPFLYMGTAFQTFSAYFGAGYLKNGNTRGASTTSIVGAIVNIVVNVAFISFFGLQAAAVSTMAGFFVMWVMRIAQTKRSLGIKLKFRKLFIFGALALAFAIVCSVSDRILSDMGVTDNLQSLGIKSPQIMFDVVMTVIALIIAAAANKEIVRKLGRLIKRRL